MGSYSVYIKPSAAKELEAIPQKKFRRQIVTRIRGLGENPYPKGVTKLVGHELYRIRQGTYRIDYAVNEGKLIVEVIKIGHRKDVYRVL